MVFTTRLAGGKGGRNAFDAHATTLAELQVQLGAFTDEYNHSRPHRSHTHRATPATVDATRPKAHPATRIDAPNRVRTDRFGRAGSVTLRVNGRLHHIGIGRSPGGPTRKNRGPREGPRLFRCPATSPASG
jgi:hypothetical protein